MIRPCFLVIDRERALSISTRKLVIESAKLNVITAYSSSEAVETLAAFPSVRAAVLDVGMKDMSCEELIRQLKMLQPDLPVIVVGAPRQGHCEGADYFLESFEPQRLLDLLKELEPEKTALIEEQDAILAEQT